MGQEEPGAAPELDQSTKALKSPVQAQESAAGPLRAPTLTKPARLGQWIAVLGSLVTIAFTVVSVYTKNQIDQKEEQLRAEEIRVRERTAGVDESKEKVERYKWVFTLLTSLGNGEDATKQSFTIGLIRLALTKDEAEQLFAGFRFSSNQELRTVGEQGFELDKRLKPVQELQQTVNALCRSFGEMEEEKFVTSCKKIGGIYDFNARICVTKEGRPEIFRKLCD